MNHQATLTFECDCGFNMFRIHIGQKLKDQHAKGWATCTHCKVKYHCTISSHGIEPKETKKK